MLSRRFPGRLLRPNCARERIDTLRGTRADCIVERFQRTQTRLPRVLDAPARGRTPVHNRSTEALLNQSWADRCSRVRHFRWGRLLFIALFTGATAFAAMGFELRFQLFKLGLLLSGQNGLHLLMKLKS